MMETQNAVLRGSSTANRAPVGGAEEVHGPTATPLSAVSWPSRLKRVTVEEVENLQFRLLLANLVVMCLPPVTFSRLRTAIYRLAGLRIGPHSIILGRIKFTGLGPITRRLQIGSNTIINVDFFADLNADIRIGNWVSIGHDVTFITAEHLVGPASCRAGKMRPTPISVEDGCWIGARSTILPGVTIGKSSIVAAGSVVSGSVPPNRMVGGNPARPLKSLPTEP
jgi:acetyltransferase-like isoleucine patch superfamily enzyme